MTTFYKKSEPIPLFKEVQDVPNEVYHQPSLGVSSSQLKDILEDEAYFYAKHVAQTIPREEISAFGVGTYFHGMVLEPHRLKDECAIFEGVRRGSKWEQFLTENKTKTIVTQSQADQAGGLVDLVHKSPVAMSFVSQGTPETTVVVKLRVIGGEIFCPDMGCILSTKFGWLNCDVGFDKGIPLVVKVRADSHGGDWILDLKSTTGNAKVKRNIKDKISKYNYDLSAALYLDMFNLVPGVNKSRFLWTFASKDTYNCKTYVASDENIQVGRAKYRRALLKLADGIANNWKFSDELEEIEPNFFERDYLKQTDLDLL